MQITPKKIYSTIGVYNNGDRKLNGVILEDLINHIVYNLEMRHGRAFFLEGQCLNVGYLSLDRINDLESEFKLNPHSPDIVSSSYK